MSFLDRVRACQAWSPAAYRPWFLGDERIGFIRHGLASRLRDFPQVFEVADHAVRLRPGLAGFARLSAAVGEVAAQLVAAGDLERLRGEAFPVAPRWGRPPYFVLDRGVVPSFGVRGYGVHMNGLVDTDAGLHIWVATRALDKRTAPGKLDHLVAGGQPHGLGILENLVKEAAEEAEMPAALACRARPASLVSYRCELPEGLRDDVLFCFDLALPPDFQPRNRDGEVTGFALWPLERVWDRVRDSEDFKFNVALVLIDLFVRLGRIGPDDPDYMAIAQGLRRSEAPESEKPSASAAEGQFRPS